MNKKINKMTKEYYENKVSKGIVPIKDISLNELKQYTVNTFQNFIDSYKIPFKEGNDMLILFCNYIDNKTKSNEDKMSEAFAYFLMCSEDITNKPDTLDYKMYYIIFDMYRIITMPDDFYNKPGNKKARRVYFYIILNKGIEDLRKSIY